jgi:hypothetical protein
VATDEGYLRGEAVVTRIGVFSYQNADGSIRRELRHPDDVLSTESLDSLRMIPITVDHPNELVTAANADKLSVGQTGENLRVDGRHVLVPLTITASRGIAAVKDSGRQELSLGYKLDLVEEKGNYDGEAYTHRQRNIRYNHLALVHAARAGKAARLNLDGVDASVLIDEETRPMLKVNVDGIQYDAAPEVARALEKATSAAAAAETSRLAEKTRADKAEAERDVAQSSLATEKARADKAEAERIAKDDVGKLVRARVDLEAKAARVLSNTDGLDVLSDRAVMEKAIGSRHQDVKFDGKSDDYVQAAFDMMIAGLGTVQTKLDQATGRPLAAPPTRSDAEAEQAAYQKSVDRLNGWRTQSAA